MKQSLFFICFAVLSLSGFAQKNKTINVGKDAIAVQGYDVVGYFDGYASEGYEKIRSEFKGIQYLFTSLTNKEIFDKNPEKYVPQYGGWCAYAMGIDGSKVKIDPKTYKVLDDKLYLFYNFRGTNTLNPWNDNEQSLKAEADKQWQNLMK